MADAATSRTPARRRPTTAAWTVVVLAIVLLAAAIALLGVAGDDTVPGETSIGAIVSDPDQYVGREVTVIGQVESEKADDTLLVEEDALLEGDDLFVIADRTGVEDIDPEALVRATGRVGIVERDYAAWAEDEQLFDDFALRDVEGEVVIFATSVEVLED